MSLSSSQPNDGPTLPLAGVEERSREARADLWSVVGYYPAALSKEGLDCDGASMIVSTWAAQKETQRSVRRSAIYLPSVFVS